MRATLDTECERSNAEVAYQDEARVYLGTVGNLQLDLSENPAAPVAMSEGPWNRPQDQDDKSRHSQTLHG